MAGAGRRVFQPGEVLTASNVMSYLQDQAVMVFDDAAARGSAIGTAVVSEGMVTYLKDANEIQYYDGSAWRSSFGGTAVLPIANGGTGASTLAGAQDNLGVGLIPVSPTSIVVATGSGSANALGKISFTGATSLSLNGIFTSAYENYRIVISYTNISQAMTIRMRFRASGSDNTSSTYQLGGAGGRNGGTSPYNYSEATTTSMTIGDFTTTVYFGQTIIDICRPQKNERTNLTFNTACYMSAVAAVFGHCLCDNTNQFDGFTIYPSAGNIAGTLQVFGYNE